jgi:hypothetical protein
LIKIEQKKYIFRLKILFYIRNVKFSLKTIKDGWGRLRTVEDGWGRLGTVGDGWGRLGTVGDGWGRLRTVGDGGRWGDGEGTVRGRDWGGDGDGTGWDADKIGIFTVVFLWIYHPGIKSEFLRPKSF